LNFWIVNWKTKNSALNDKTYTQIRKHQSQNSGKGKAIPLKALTGPEGSKQGRIYARAKGARAQGRHIKKKIEIEVWYAGKKGCPRERNLREIYTENTMFCLLSVFCVFCLHITEYEEIRGRGAKFSWAQGRKTPKYGPGSKRLRPPHVKTIGTLRW
jgi:hypothetical protein